MTAVAVALIFLLNISVNTFMTTRLGFVAVPSRSQVYSCVSASAQLSIFDIPPVISSRLKAFSSYTPPPKRSLTSCVAALKPRSQAACFSHDSFSRAYRHRSVSPLSGRGS